MNEQHLMGFGLKEIEVFQILFHWLGAMMQTLHAQLHQGESKIQFSEADHVSLSVLPVEV